MSRKLLACRLCPRMCGQIRDGSTPCRNTQEMRIARAALHFWEEPPISGERGSGAVFFTGCPLGCRYCQNYDISRNRTEGRAVTPRELSDIFFRLINEGAHNINLVTATQFIPGVREALMIRKLPVPVVYNSSGYERRESLRSLEGLIDIYLPDFKYAQSGLAGALSNAPDYPDIAVKAIHEMVQEVGPPEYDESGMMVRGVLIRHLILPGHTKNSIQALKIIAREFPGIPVSLMAQYTPWGEAREGIDGYPELSRAITKRELIKVRESLFELGLDGFVQSRKAGGAEFIPEFQ